MTSVSGKKILNRTRTKTFLDELDRTPADEAMTLYLPPHTRTTEIENIMQQIPAPPGVLAEIGKITGGSRTGNIIFWSPEKIFSILPPFPVTEHKITSLPDTGPLRSLLKRNRLIALVLVRLGSYAVGVCEDEKLLSSKVGTGLVHGRHRQGGSSAHRFERHRDKQIEYFLTRVCARSREHIEPYVKSLDYIVYGGARTTIQLLKKQCTFIGRLKTPALPPLYDIPEPQKAVLEKAVSQVWSSTVFEWRED